MNTRSRRRKQLLWQALLVGGLLLETGFILLALYAMIITREDIPAWQQIAFVAILVWIYIAYLKQRSLDLSAHMVDEKIKTHSLVENLEEGILLAGPENHLLLLNASASALTGISEITALGKNLEELVDERIGRMLSSGQAGEIETPFSKGGPHLHVSIKPISNREGTDPYKLIRVRPVAAPAQTAEPAGQETLAVLQRLVRELAQEPPLSPDKRARLALRSEEAILLLSSHGTRLAIGSRTLAGALKREPLGLDESIQGLLKEYGTQIAAAGLDLQTSLAPLRIQADSSLLDTALRLFLLPALQASPPGGKVTLKLAELGENAGLSIQDAGPGLPAAELPGLFEAPGQKAGRSTEAYFLARGIIEAHGGSAWADSPEGTGMKVTLMIPSN